MVKYLVHPDELYLWRMKQCKAHLDEHLFCQLATFTRAEDGRIFKDSLTMFYFSSLPQLSHAVHTLPSDLLSLSLSLLYVVVVLRATDRWINGLLPCRKTKIGILLMKRTPHIIIFLCHHCFSVASSLL